MHALNSIALIQQSIPVCFESSLKLFAPKIPTKIEDAAVQIETILSFKRNIKNNQAMLEWFQASMI